jgi:SAM-dependent methyltransferase
LVLETSQSPSIIDYEGSCYRAEFWEGQGREYEDLVDRMAIQRLMPSSGGMLVEAGAGFGRLAGLYTGYKCVVLVDYSLSLLQEARQAWGNDERFKFVAASIYALPFVDALVDTVVMVRVMHHLESPAMALGEVARISNGGGVLLLEYANKRNLKAVFRYLSFRQTWSPFAHEPYEFVRLNFDFHPVWMTSRLLEAGFILERELSISSLRLDVLKRRFSPEVLAKIDSILSSPGAPLKLGPSIMARCRAVKQATSPQGFFRCPSCQGIHLVEEGTSLLCTGCHTAWPIRDGVYDFRAI